MYQNRVTALSLEALIVHLYREKNCTGFLRAFSDQPERITSGLPPQSDHERAPAPHSTHLPPISHGDKEESGTKKGRRDRVVPVHDESDDTPRDCDAHEHDAIKTEEVECYGACFIVQQCCEILMDAIGGSGRLQRRECVLPFVRCAQAAGSRTA